MIKKMDNSKEPRTLRYSFPKSPKLPKYPKICITQAQIAFTPEQHLI